MKRLTICLLTIGLLALSLTVLLLSRDILSIEPLSATPETSTKAEGNRDFAAIEARLLNVGLHPTGALSDLGIDDHLARLDQGATTSAVLFAYADAIEALTERSSSRGQALPPTLWDVSTPSLLDAGWTVYSLTAALASDEGDIHVDLLTDAYGSFLNARPNALEGALALIPLASGYVRALPEHARAEHEAHAKTDGEATLLIWQALLSGTSRLNPITHKPLWSHGFVGHFSVPHIHQYATERGLRQSQVWGVAGFAPKFVGPSSNTNQVEHLGISALLQGVGNIPEAVLEAVEVLEIAIDHEDPNAAAADRALNAAVRDVLVPRIEDDPQNLTTALRAALGQTPK